MTEMGRQLVCPRATQDQIASNHPKIYLQLQDYIIIRETKLPGRLN